MKKTNVKNVKLNNLLIIVILILTSVFLFSTITNKNIGVANSIDYKEDAIIVIPDINEDFDDTCIMVVMNKKISEINKEYSKGYFGNCQIESIEDLTYISGDVNDKEYLNKNDFKQILKINLIEQSKQSVINNLLAIQNVEEIYWAGPHYFDNSMTLSDSPQRSNWYVPYKDQWGIHGSKGVNAPDAWKITSGDKRVKVGIIDTGIADNRCLDDNLVAGWDFVNNNSITNDDPDGHGTHIAGIIGAIPNANGVSGVCHNVQLIPLQVSFYDSDGKIKFEMLASIKAISWAINNNVDILNYSGGNTTDYEPFKNAIKNYQGLFVCSAGNKSCDVDINKHYPSDYSQDQVFSNRVISVGAIYASGNITSISNYGAKSVSIFAPGARVLSTLPTNINSSGYGFKDGTSMATPFVTGTAALMFSLYLDAESTGEYGMSHADIAAEIKKKIIQSATYDSNLTGKCVANGRLNAYDAVRLAASFDTTVLSDNTLQINGIGHHYYDNDILTIPETIKGRLVTKIAPWAFANTANIKQVNFPPLLREIGYNAFQNSADLQSLYFQRDKRRNNYLSIIGNAAFYNCTNLKTVSIPDNVISIGYNAFENCINLQSIGFTKESKISSINNSAFAGCSNLLVVNCPASLKTIGTHAFKDCTRLFYVTMLDEKSQLTDIGSSAFDSCIKLEAIQLPSSLKNIGANAFNLCSKLQTITLSDNVTSIGANAFAGCSELTIFTSRASAVAGWISTWNSSNRPVFFGCELKGDIPYVNSFTKTASNPTNRSAENGLVTPSRRSYNFDGWYTTADFSGTKYDDIISAPNGKLYVNWVESTSCITEGSMITLADGTQKAVENLTGDEQLLVWNMFTGTFDTAPILFIDSERRQEYEVINLKFSDGTSVKVIYEHAFWDFDLNKYVFLRSDAAKYVGHWFNKQILNVNGDNEWIKVQLVDVELTTEITTAWSPVTYGHLCYYVNGMLSMPGATEGLINIFDVDGDTMKIDEAAFNKDIEKYGLFTYEEFAEILPISEQVFEAFGGRYLKVAIGKGLISIDQLAILIARYQKFFI